MRHLKKKFKEDYHSDGGYDILPKYIQILNLISSIIPVILIFVPRTLDDNKGIFTSIGERKYISDLKYKIEKLKDGQDEMKKQLENQKKEIEQQKIEMNQYKKEMEEKINKLLGKKRKKKYRLCKGRGN